MSRGPALATGAADVLPPPGAARHGPGEVRLVPRRREPVACRRPAARLARGPGPGATRALAVGAAGGHRGGAADRTDWPVGGDAGKLCPAAAVLARLRAQPGRDRCQ